MNGYEKLAALIKSGKESAGDMLIASVKSETPFSLAVADEVYFADSFLILKPEGLKLEKDDIVIAYVDGVKVYILCKSEVV